MLGLSFEVECTQHLFSCSTYSHAALNPFTIVVIEIRPHYQLAQSVLKIGSALTEKVGQGEVGGCTTLGDSAWRLLQLAINNAWSVLESLFFCFPVRTSVENGPLPCRDSISGFLGSFQSGGAFSGQRT